MEKILHNELRVWRQLRHPHILPLYGTTSFGPRVAMVCPWKESGNLSKFLGENIALGPTERYQILLGVLSGLLYLHVHSIIHGDLTGSNILVGATGAGSVVLSDFGLSTRLVESGISVQPSSCESLSSLNTLGLGAGGQRSARWAAPEIITPSRSGFGNDRPTKASDVYSFGRIALQVLSGSIPYYHITNEAAVILELSNGIDPPRSLYPGVGDDIWELIEWCSAREPQRRPMLITVWRRIKRLYDIAEIENWYRDDLERKRQVDGDEDWQVITVGHGVAAFA